MGQVPERREQRAESVEGRERESGEKGERRDGGRVCVDRGRSLVGSEAALCYAALCCVGRHWAFRASQHSATHCAVPLGAGGLSVFGLSEEPVNCPVAVQASDGSQRQSPPPGTQNAQFGGPEQRSSNQLGPVRACVTERGSQWPGEQGRCQVSVKQTTGQSIDDGTRSRTKLAEEHQRRIRAYVGPGTWTVERGRVGRGGIWDTIIQNGMGIVWRQNRLTEQTSKGRDRETWNKGPTRVQGACMRARLRPRLV